MRACAASRSAAPRCCSSRRSSTSFELFSWPGSASVVRFSASASVGERDAAALRRSRAGRARRRAATSSSVTTLRPPADSPKIVTRAGRRRTRRCCRAPSASARDQVERAEVARAVRRRVAPLGAQRRVAQPAERAEAVVARSPRSRPARGEVAAVVEAARRRSSCRRRGSRPSPAGAPRPAARRRPRSAARRR